MTSRPVPKRAHPWALLCGLLGLTLAYGPPVASAQEMIAHQGTDTDRLTRNEARLFFTMRLKRWPNGALVKVFVLPDNHPLHQRFANEILGLYPYQLRRVWDRQLFSGTGQAPITVADDREMLERVATTPGAIGYAAEPAEGQDLRVLEVR